MKKSEIRLNAPKDAETYIRRIELCVFFFAFILEIIWIIIVVFLILDPVDRFLPNGVDLLVTFLLLPVGCLLPPLIAKTVGWIFALKIDKTSAFVALFFWPLTASSNIQTLVKDKHYLYY